MRFILIQLLVFLIYTICINGDSEQGVVQGRYNFNHPPWAEDYNPIPVAVVYEDDVISGKAIRTEVEPNFKLKADFKLEPDIEKESQITEKTGTEVIVSLTDAVKITDREDDVLVKPRARALDILQIPVMVVYDPITDTPSSQTQTPPTKRRKIKQLRRRKLQNKTSITTEEPLVQHSEPSTPRNIMTEGVIEPTSFSNRERTVGLQTLRKHGEADPVVPIIYSENRVYGHSGNFHYSYEGGDGTRAHSEGQLMRNSDDEAAGEAVAGGFSYTDKEGNEFSLSYTADERGYRPIGAHLPTPPPIPPAIARALAYLATATTPEPVTKPSKT